MEVQSVVFALRIAVDATKYVALHFEGRIEYIITD